MFKESLETQMTVREALTQKIKWKVMTLKAMSFRKQRDLTKASMQEVNWRLFPLKIMLICIKTSYNKMGNPVL